MNDQEVFLKELLKPIHEQYEQDQLALDIDMRETFDWWLVDNLDMLGNTLYNKLGNMYGDLDNASAVLDLPTHPDFK